MYESRPDVEHPNADHESPYAHLELAPNSFLSYLESLFCFCPKVFSASLSFSCDVQILDGLALYFCQQGSHQHLCSAT